MQKTIGTMLLAVGILTLILAQDITFLLTFGMLGAVLFFTKHDYTTASKRTEEMFKSTAKNTYYKKA